MSNPANIFTFDWSVPVPDEVRDQWFDAIAAAVRRWRMELPVCLFLETTGPLSNIAGQAAVVFSPFLAVLLPGGMLDVQRCVKLLENPANARLLMDRIEEGGAHAARE